MVRYTASFKKFGNDVQTSEVGTASQLTSNIVADEIEANVVTSGQITADNAIINQISSGYVTTPTITSNDTLEIFTPRGLMLDVINNFGIQIPIDNTVMVQGNFNVQIPNNGNVTIAGEGTTNISSTELAIDASIDINNSMVVNDGMEIIGNIVLKYNNELPDNVLKTTEEGHLEFTDNMNHTTVLSMPEEINLESYYGFQPWCIYPNDEIFTYHQIHLPSIDSASDNGIPLVIENNRLVANSADEKLTNNTTPIQNVSVIIDGLNPVTYSWKSNNNVNHGFIAQEVQQLLPEATYESNGCMGYRVEPLVAYLVAYVKELKQEIEILKQQNI